MHWKIHPNSQAKPQLVDSSDFSTGLLYGYSVYTTFKFPLDSVWIQAHLTRLENNAKALDLQWPFTQAQLLEAIHALYQPETPVYRLTLIPQVEQYGDFYSQRDIPSRLLLSLRAAPPSSPQPISLKTVPYTRPLPEIKMAGIGELIFWKRQAQTEGFNDILLVNSKGTLSEASTANLFCIRQGQLYTPNPMTDHCLPGISRLQILQAARKSGISIKETSIPKAEIDTLDGAFLANAVQTITPINRIDDFHLPWPESATALLNQLRAQLS